MGGPLILFANDMSKNFLMSVSDGLCKSIFVRTMKDVWGKKWIERCSSPTRVGIFTLMFY